jgi:hypothetical protein
MGVNLARSRSPIWRRCRSVSGIGLLPRGRNAACYAGAAARCFRGRPDRCLQEAAGRPIRHGRDQTQLLFLFRNSVGGRNVFYGDDGMAVSFSFKLVEDLLGAGTSNLNHSEVLEFFRCSTYPTRCFFGEAWLTSASSGFPNMSIWEGGIKAWTATNSGSVTAVYRETR